MNEKNTKTLLKDFPNLYKQYYWDKTETCLCWGFDVMDGWFDLIYDLSQRLEIVCPECEACQVKEKFGGARIYVNNCNEEGHKLISEAEKKSFTICEICGEKGKLHPDLGWHKTLCKKHYKIFKDPLEYKKFKEGEKIE